MWGRKVDMTILKDIQQEVFSSQVLEAAERGEVVFFLLEEKYEEDREQKRRRVVRAFFPTQQSAFLCSTGHRKGLCWEEVFTRGVPNRPRSGWLIEPINAPHSWERVIIEAPDPVSVRWMEPLVEGKLITLEEFHAAMEYFAKEEFPLPRISRFL